MDFPADFLDRLRAAVRVSEVMATKFKLRKAGADYEVIGNASLKCNDRKGVWTDFADGGRGGDVFKFYQEFEGLKFPEAVERVAGLAGIRMPRDRRENGGSNGHHNGDGPPAPDMPPWEAPNGNGNAAEHDRGGQGHSAGGRTATRTIVAEWNYTDEEGRALYQTVRVQWRNADGTWKVNEKTGKPAKTFLQRRRSPDVDGTWVNSLRFLEDDGNPVEFMRRGPGADWLRYDPDNYRKWHYTERKYFDRFGNVPHTLLNLPIIIEELAEERHEQRTIFIPEGEKKVDLLTSWDCLATCNSGGAQNWHAGMAHMLRGAADIVILEDNDDAGRKRTAKMAPMLIEEGCRVRALSMRDIWPDCPPKGDVVDWAERGGGSRSALLKAAYELPEWTPPPFESRYGALTWGSWRGAELESYPWQIKGLIPAGEPVLIMGPSGSGKSFETTNMALSVARGIPYNGRQVRQAGVVYLNYESSNGMPLRLRAYEQHFGVHPDERIPFAWMARPPGIYASEENATEIAREVKELTKDWSVPVGVVIVDTHNAANRGSSEIKTEDVTRIMDRYAKIQADTGCGLWIVGHTNSLGEHRGNEVLFNAIETTLLIDRMREGTSKNAPYIRDRSGRVLRRATVRKQRQGVDGVTWDFVLDTVELGKDADGDPITSLISRAPDIDREDGDPAVKRRPRFGREERIFLNAMRTALENEGVTPPNGLNLPNSVGLAVRWGAFCEAHQAGLLPEETQDEAKYRGRRKRAGEDLKLKRVIGICRLGEETWLWLAKDNVKSD